MGAYSEMYARWQADPEGFWAEAAKAIDWIEPPKAILDDSRKPLYSWFPGGKVNTAWNCLDRHVEGGRADQDALIYDSPVTDTRTRYTYRELRDKVAELAGWLRDRGVVAGDRVIVYMPMVPEALFAMLACARLGAIHSVVFGGFAAKELATRINDAKPKAIISASCGVEPGRVVAYKPLLDEAIELASFKPEFTLIWQRPMLAASLVEGRDFDWGKVVPGTAPADCVPVASTDPLYVLYTSGTTGIPKGVVRDNAGHMVALAWSMTNIYGAAPGEVFWAASDVGWVVGHSYITYGPLLIGATTILYEGKPVGTPDAGAFWRVIEEYDVRTQFCAPTAFRAIKKEDPDGKLLADYDISCLRTLFLAGERADPDTIQWAERMVKVPVIDHWWQTESGWPMAANMVGVELLPVKYGSPTCAVPGYDIRVLDNDNNEMKRGEIGSIVVRLPLAPGALPTLWQNDDGFIRSYLQDFPGYYKTGDAGYIDEDGYIYVMSRTDDIINVAGHRLSTGGMEEVLSYHPDVAECAVIGAADQLKGQVPVGFVVLKAGVTRPDEEIEKELVRLVRDKIGPVAAFKTVTVVKRLPKTRSGKILRGTMRKIADSEQWSMPATIDDPIILDEIADSLRAIGYAKTEKGAA